MTFKEQTEFKQLEKEIAQLSQSKISLTAKLNSESNHIELQKLAEQLEEIILSLDEKELRWLELSEYM